MDFKKESDDQDGRFDMAGTTVDGDNGVYKTLQGRLQIMDTHLHSSRSLPKVQERETAGSQKILAINQIEDDQLSSAIYLHFETSHEAYTYLDVQPQPHAERYFNY
jgi:hypothetical protein